MQPSIPGSLTNPLLEKVLAIAGAVVCLIVTISLWWSISNQQPMWPLPGLYFMEMVAVSLVSAVVFVHGGSRSRLIPWGAIGILFAFSIIGAFSVGFFYIPVAIIFGAAASLSDVRSRQPIDAHLGVCMLAGIAQAALMLAAIRLLY